MNEIYGHFIPLLMLPKWLELLFIYLLVRDYMLLSSAKDDLILGQMPNTMIVCFHFVYAGDPVQSRKCGHHSGIIFFSSWFMDPHCESVITFFSVNRSQLDAEAMLHYAHIYGDWE